MVAIPVLTAAVMPTPCSTRAGLHAQEICKKSRSLLHITKSSKKQYLSTSCGSHLLQSRFHILTVQMIFIQYKNSCRQEIISVYTNLHEASLSCLSKFRDALGLWPRAFLGCSSYPTILILRRGLSTPCIPGQMPMQLGRDRGMPAGICETASDPASLEHISVHPADLHPDVVVMSTLPPVAIARACL